MRSEHARYSKSRHRSYGVRRQSQEQTTRQVPMAQQLFSAISPRDRSAAPPRTAAVRRCKEMTYAPAFDRSRGSAAPRADRPARRRARRRAPRSLCPADHPAASPHPRPERRPGLRRRRCEDASHGSHPAHAPRARAASRVTSERARSCGVSDLERSTPGSPRARTSPSASVADDRGAAAEPTSWQSTCDDRQRIADR